MPYIHHQFVMVYLKPTICVVYDINSRAVYQWFYIEKGIVINSPGDRSTDVAHNCLTHHMIASYSDGKLVWWVLRLN